MSDDVRFVGENELVRSTMEFMCHHGKHKTIAVLKGMLSDIHTLDMEDGNLADELAQRATVVLVHSVVEVSGVPDGQYKGIWLGHKVNFRVGEDQYEAFMAHCQPQSMECVATSRDGKISINSVQPYYM